MTLFLADTSIWGWAASGRRPDIAERLAGRVENDLVATCAPVVLEALHRARSGEEYARLYETLFAPLRRLPLTDTAAERALSVQRQLASTTHGNHLRPAVDYLVAAVAETARSPCIVWCLDRDLRIICEHTGQPVEAETAA